MLRLLTFPDRLLSSLDCCSGVILGSLARLTFAATLLFYYWNSAMTKLGDGILGLFNPSVGAYAQIFPRKMEAIGYDVSQLGLFSKLVVLAGTWAELILPLLIIVGLFTRLAALGMIGFIIIQTLTDLIGHGLLGDVAATGAFFDRLPNGVLTDQRLFWVMLMLVLVVKGAGPLSLDRFLGQSEQKPKAL